MDLTDLWVVLKTRREVVSTVVIGALLFGAGWQTGRVMSPYYAAHPIVFEEGVGAPVNGTREQLQALADEGEALRTPAPSTRVAGTSTPVPALSPAGEGSAQGVFVGSRNSNLYHHFTCSTANRIKDSNQIWWPTISAAEAAGYSPSKCTRDKLGI